MSEVAAPEVSTPAASAPKGANAVRAKQIAELRKHELRIGVVQRYCEALKHSRRYREVSDRLGVATVSLARLQTELKHARARYMEAYDTGLAFLGYTHPPSGLAGDQPILRTGGRVVQDGPPKAECAVAPEHRAAFAQLMVYARLWAGERRRVVRDQSAYLRACYAELKNAKGALQRKADRHDGNCSAALQNGHRLVSQYNMVENAMRELDRRLGPKCKSPLKSRPLLF